MDISELIAALSIGALIGLENEREFPGEKSAGIRTCIIISLLGYISAILSEEFPLLLPLAFASLAVFIALLYYLERMEGRIGATREVSILASFLLGALCTVDVNLAVAISIIVFGTLLYRESIHALVYRIKEKELRSVANFLIICVLIYLLLPEQVTILWRPVKIKAAWAFSIVISIIGFVLYLLEKRQMNPLLGGIIGGFISSTAVAINIKNYVRDRNQLICAAIVVLASSILYIRIVLILLFLWPEILPLLAPLFVAYIIGMLSTAVIVKSIKGEVEEIRLRIDNPFNAVQAVSYTLLIVFTNLFLSAYERVRDIGILYTISAVSSLLTVDSLLFSLYLLRDIIPAYMAVKLIFVGILSNTVVRIGICSRARRKKFIAAVSFPLCLTMLPLVLSVVS